MKKTIDMETQLLEKNDITLPEGTRKKEGGSSSENKDICYDLVVEYLGSSSFIIDLGASRHMDFIQDFFSAVHPYSGPSILMGDDSEIPTKGIGMIDTDNGYFNNILYEWE